tara:strand:- start:2863 stop:3522 length:660 start_codon:yes stop_codon:yes gene_type:complete
MKIDYLCRIARDGYEWRTAKKDEQQLVFIKPKTKYTVTMPFPEDAYTQTCRLGWNLKQEKGDPHELIMAHVEKFGTLEGVEGASKLAYETYLLSRFKHEEFPFPYPTVENYSKFAISLYEQRLDMIEGLPRYAIETNMEAEVSDIMSVVKKVVGNKIELFAKPYKLNTAIDLQFIMYQGMVGHYKVCEYCNKPFTASRSDARFCPENSTCKVNHFRSKK